MKSIVASLVLLGAPWDCIKAVIGIKLKTNPTTSMTIDRISVDLIKDWAKQAVKQEPLLLEWSTDVQSKCHLKVKRLWLEWETAMWVNAQNMKGIPVPSRLVKTHYMNLWGVGPHVVQTQNHLESLALKSRSLKMWLHRFRRRWGFVYKAMPTKAPLTKKQMEKKVPMDGKETEARFSRDPLFSICLQTQNWVHLLVPPKGFWITHVALLLCRTA